MDNKYAIKWANMGNVAGFGSSVPIWIPLTSQGIVMEHVPKGPNGNTEHGTVPDKENYARSAA